MLSIQRYMSERDQGFLSDRDLFQLSRWSSMACTTCAGTRNAMVTCGSVICSFSFVFVLVGVSICRLNAAGCCSFVLQLPIPTALLDAGICRVRYGREMRFCRPREPVLKLLNLLRWSDAKTRARFACECRTCRCSCVSNGLHLRVFRTMPACDKTPRGALIPPHRPALVLVLIMRA